MIYEQGTRISCVRAFSYTNPDTGRKRTIREGACCWIGSTKLFQEREGAAEVIPKGASLGHGFYMKLSDIDSSFSPDPGEE